jgi:hypothetical protein
MGELKIQIEKLEIDGRLTSPTVFDQKQNEVYLLNKPC